MEDIDWKIKIGPGIWDLDAGIPAHGGEAIFKIAYVEIWDIRKKSESLLKQFDDKPNGEKKVILGKVLKKVVIRKDNCLEIHFNGPEPEFWAKKSLQIRRTSFLDYEKNGGFYPTLIILVSYQVILPTMGIITMKVTFKTTRPYQCF